MKYYVGIDGGGSRTRAVVTNDTLQILGRGDAGASNHYAVGFETAASNCRVAALAALEQATRVDSGLSAGAITAWGLGLAGVRRESDAALMQVQLHEVTDGKPFVLDHDAAAAQSGAFGSEAGIVLSAGTGSICFALDDEGNRYSADGWGPTLGDEGSGYWIGQEALKAVCRAADGRAARTRLTSPVLSELNCRDCDDLVRLVYSANLGREPIAKLARIVLDSAASGGNVAVDIRERAVGHLVATVDAVVRAILTRSRERAGFDPPQPQDISIALCGGLFEDDFFRGSVGYNIGERLVELKRDYWPVASWHVVKPQFEPAMGAALLAVKLAN